MKDPSGSAKPSSYFSQARPELVAQLPSGGLGRLLDVGCGAGGVGRALRDRVDSLVGIEVEPAAAADAREVYDQVLVGRVEDVVGELDDSVRHDPRVRPARAPRATRRGAGAAARRGRRRCAAPRLRSERPALVARPRSRPARHLRLHGVGPPRPDASPVADAVGSGGAARVDRLARRADGARAVDARPESWPSD